MAKKRVTFVDRLEHAAGDIADAVSVAATGSQIGVLELAAEDELSIKPPKRPRKRVVAKKKAATKRVAARKRAVTKKRVAKKTARRTAKKAKARSKPR